MSWEKYAPTSESQLVRLSRLKAVCGGEEAEAVVRHNQSNNPRPVPTLGDSVKPSGIAALYKESFGFGGALSTGKDELGEKARERGAQLRDYASNCQVFVANIERAVYLLDTISQQQEQVTSKTQALHATCESLLEEQKRLEAQVNALSSPLERFRALEELGPALGLPFASPVRGDEVSKSGVAVTAGRSPGRVSYGGGGTVVGGGSGNLRRSSSFGRGGPAGRALLYPGSDDFAQALARAASAMSYLRGHPEFLESPQYIEKYSQLISRALALVKNQVVEYLEQAARLSAEKPVDGGRLETSEIYSRFRVVSHRVNAGIVLMRKYVSAVPLVKTLLAECNQLYLEKRLFLLRPAVRAQLEAMSNQRGLTAMIRFGAAFLVRVGQLETQLYDACLGHQEEEARPSRRVDREEKADGSGDPGREEEKKQPHGRGDNSAAPGDEELEGEVEADADDGKAGLHAMLLQLCSELHKHLRPRVYHGTDMDTLCELVSVVREEIVEEQRARRVSAQARTTAGGGVSGEGIEDAAAVEMVLMKLVQDSQERLIYMATKVIQEDIAAFRPTAEDLDYPGVLKRARARVGTAAALPRSSTMAGTSTISSPPVSAYSTWYPPLRSTLLVLSKVYRAVDMGVFEDLAQLAVAACAESMQRAAIAISAGVYNHPAASPSSGGGRGGRARVVGGAIGGERSLDAQLFLIKHLLTLREQLTPFHIQFVRAEHKLNFGSTRMALRKFIRHTPSLFRLSRKNALLELTVDSIPTIDEIQVDAKGDMEASLKSACSAFINCAVELIASPLISFINKARAFEESGEGGLASLRTQPFASPERAKEAVYAALFSATAALPRVCKAMSLYLDNKATEAILLHPVQRRVVDSVDSVRDVLQRLHPAKDLQEVMSLLGRVSQLALSAGDEGVLDTSAGTRTPNAQDVGL